jgi:hypothetical protein
MVVLYNWGNYIYYIIMMEEKMKVRILTAMIFIFLFLSVSLVYSAVVYMNPASQDSQSIGKFVEFNIKVKEVIDLAAYQIEISFDKTAIKLTSLSEGDFLKTGFGDDPSIEGTIPFVMTTATSPSKSTQFDSITPDVYVDVNSVGKLVVANSRYSTNELKGVDGEGGLLSLTFEVLVNKASNIQLNAPFDDSELILVDSKSAVIESQLAGAVINEAPVCVKGDVNNDGEINAKDVTLTLRISVGLITPTPQELCAADITDDGNVNSQDAIKILKKSAGLEAPAIEPVNDLNVVTKIKLDDVHSTSGGNISVPLRITQAGIVAGGDILITYDPTILNAVDVLSDQDLLLMANTSKPGIIKISFANSVGYESDILAEIKFNVISDNTSRLSLQQATLYRDDLMPIKPKKEDGWFTSWAMPAKDNALLQNFPNPFNPETWIPFQLKQDSDVAIKIFSATGELVRELDLGTKPAGMYVSQDRAAYWDGKNKFGIPVASGIYFYSVKTKDFSAVRKLIVLK